MRFPVLLIILSAFFTSQGQSTVRGLVVDSVGRGVTGAHVINDSKNLLDISKGGGLFSIRAEVGDTLLVSDVRYINLEIIVTEELLRVPQRWVLLADELQLDEFVIHSLPTLAQFRQTIIETEVKDSTNFWYFGVDQPVPRVDEMVTTNRRKQIMYAILQPHDFIYYNLSKTEKEKRAYYEIQQNQFRDMRVSAKFTRAWVQETTGLEGDRLTTFISYCNYTPEYIDETPLYMIMEDMLSKLEDFQGGIGKG